MIVAAPAKVELIYDVHPDVRIPDVKFQTQAVQLVKNEAATRAVRGEPLEFRFDVNGLFEISVQPALPGVPLPPTLTSRDFVVRRKGNHNGNGSATNKHIEHMLLSEDTYPSDVWLKRFDNLVGLDEIKGLVLTMLQVLFSDDIPKQWFRKYYPHKVDVDLLEQPYPVFVFEGMPGLGKSELGRSIGDPLARALGTQVVQYRVGLQVRGEGLVGQLSQNILKVIEFARMRHQERGVPILLLIDEADAIGQSRDIKEQHQEERAGLNLLLQQIDGLRDASGVAIILTTNRPGVLDKALKERSGAHWITFPDSTYDVRHHLFARSLGDLLPSCDLQALAAATRGHSPRGIAQLCRRAVIEAITRDAPLTKDLLLHAVSSHDHAHPANNNGSRVYQRKSLPRNRTKRVVNTNGHRLKRAKRVAASYRT